MVRRKLHSNEFPHYVKYMGSKTKILPFIIEGLNKVHTGRAICDLFAGSCSLSGALGDQIPIISNDIQKYSSVLAKTYLIDWNNHKTSINDVIKSAKEYHQIYYQDLVKEYKYPEEPSIKEFNAIEIKSRSLIESEFNNDWHLFTKYYSGTWWSTEQCTWIDSLRKAIEDYNDNPIYNTLLSSLMFAAAYNSQGTGHYAQYRDAKDDSSLRDINIYRSKSIIEYFTRKAEDSLRALRNRPNPLNHRIMAEDYLDCLNKINNCTIYADPPYCFVHYSRFYHILETLVLYDYPNIQSKNGIFVKGRYREDRHQSPFCIRTQVEKAFDDMFYAINNNNCSLALSYSNTGMITANQLVDIACKYFERKKISIKSMKYTHMTMGRKEDRTRDVQEMLLLIKR
jgi:site-specific DNA-methyltransferase